MAQPIIINFPGLVDDAGAAENAVHVSSVPPVPGKFYWKSPTQLRWRPLSFWPAYTAVTVDAGGTVSSFHTGDTPGGHGRRRHAPINRHPQRDRGEDHPDVDGSERPLARFSGW